VRLSRFPLLFDCAEINGETLYKILSQTLN